MSETSNERRLRLRREASARWRAKLSPEQKRALYERNEAKRSPDQIYRRKKWHVWHEANRPAKKMFTHAKSRAKLCGVPFDLIPEDISIPATCPVLGIPLSRGAGKLHDGSPTLDRFIPELGYVRGNVCVVSHRANRIKNDASLLELEAVAKWMRSR